MERSATATDPMVGRVLDRRYRVGPQIARGGMAVVYEATDLRLERTVAVKVMHPGLADNPEFVSRFEREARAAARLAHPNVVAVFDQGEDDGTLFLAMEYVPGLTLRDLVRSEAPMSPVRAMSLLEPVLSALSAAHAAGIVHRDVKPENVLVADGGRVKVADFGLARAINAETQNTATGAVLIGTVSYLSPELVVDGRADARADVYAAGVMLYELLTGQKPHQADSPIQVAYKHVHEDIPAPSLRVRGLPAYVDALVARATSRDASARPADARVLLHHVRRVRNALEHGVAEDRELTEDLIPARPRTTDTGELVELTGDLPQVIIDPSDRAAVAAREDEWDDLLPEVIAPTPPAGRSRGPRQRRRRRPRALLVLLLLVVLGLGAGYWLGIARYTSTPGVIDLAVAPAKAKLATSGLDLRVSSTRYSEDVVKGAVMTTDPMPGSRVRKDGTVAAVVSLGPERHAVPVLAGKSLDQAQALLQDAHLAYGDPVRAYSETVPAGQVIGSDPAAATELRRNTAVDVTVSRGPQPIPITDYTGQDATAAAEALTQAGFTVPTPAKAYDDKVPEGDVVSQSPARGNGVKGDKVELVVSRGPHLVTVPDVHTMGVDDAIATLRAAGLKAVTKHSDVYIGLQYVLTQSPGSGDRVPLGSTITLSLV